MASDPGVPLADYRQHNAGVLLICRDCQTSRTFELEVVIARLEARGVGSGATGIKAVAGFVTDPCPRCGGRPGERRISMPSLRMTTPVMLSTRRSEPRLSPIGPP
jgi:hypothetical protein